LKINIKKNIYHNVSLKTAGSYNLFICVFQANCFY